METQQRLFKKVGNTIKAGLLEQDWFNFLSETMELIFREAESSRKEEQTQVRIIFFALAVNIFFFISMVGITIQHWREILAWYGWPYLGNILSIFLARKTLREYKRDRIREIMGSSPKDY